jgi:hypothetical protein
MLYVRKNTLHRPNTYLSKECFKLIAYAATIEKADEGAQWLTNSRTAIRGIYGCPFNNTQMITFFRAPGVRDREATTVAVEGYVVFADSIAEWNKIAPELEKAGYIPWIVVVYEDGKEEIKNDKHFIDNKYKSRFNLHFFKKESTNDNLKNLLDKLDKDELERVRGEFLYYDKDGSGFLDKDELKQIAVKIGEDTESEDFRKSMEALDFNGDGQISFTEYIAWWKIGKTNVHTLPMIWDLNAKTQNWISSILNVQKFYDQIMGLDYKDSHEPKRAQHKLYVRCPGRFEIKSNVELSLAISGPKRTEMALDFIKQFTTNQGHVKNNWLSILFPLNSTAGLGKEKARHYLEETKETFFAFIEVEYGKHVANFFRNLMLFEVSATDSAAVIAIRFKIDIEDLIRGSLNKLVMIVLSLSEQKESAWIDMKMRSNLDPYEYRNQTTTIENYLKTAEFYMEGQGFKERNSILMNNFTSYFGKALNLFKLFFIPEEIDIEYHGNVSELVDENSKALLILNMQNFGRLLEILKSVVPDELLEASKGIEFGLNAFELFARLRYSSNTMFGK